MQKRTIGPLDLAAEYELLGDDIRSVVDQVLTSQHFIGGPAIAELEAALATRVGVKHSIAVTSGTDALLCSLMALGIGAGDEVIVPTFTFFATAGAVARTGATPVFVDIDAATFNLNPAKVSQAVTSATKAIMPVHLFGQAADMDAINDIATKHKLKVVEDAAQAIGAVYKDRSVGSLGDAACLSFYPTKNLGGFGEGGMILTNNDALATRMRQLRNHGETTRYVHEFVGGNFRLDTMKAAILLVKLRHLDDFTKRRQAVADQYRQSLADMPLTLPTIAPEGNMVYHQFSILSDQRDALAAYLREQGVHTGIYYPIPLHRQKCFESLGYKVGSMPTAERVCQQILSLPCHPMLSEEDVERVASNIRTFYDRQSSKPRTGQAGATCSS